MPTVIGMFEDSSSAQQALARMRKEHIDGGRIKIVGDESSATSEAAAGLHAAVAAMDIPTEDLTGYEDQLRQGKVLLAVRADDQSAAERVANLMEVGGAEDVEGAGARGNVEAAPGYEGARTGEASDARPERTAAARRRVRIFGIGA